jgi:predicted nucleotide-binding protein (sugar kinase/HSP70/actin superfamily)
MTGKYGYDMDRWDKIMDDMIEGFTLVRECAKGEDLEIGFNYHSEEEKDKMNKHMQEKFPNWRLTTKEEEEKINRAFDLFKEYFFNLWD